MLAATTRTAINPTKRSLVMSSSFGCRAPGRLQAHGFHDPVRLQTGLLERLCDLLDGVGFDQVQAGLVARDQDRAQVANAVSVAETGEGGRVRLCVDAVELDQVFGHRPRLGPAATARKPGNRGSLL